MVSLLDESEIFDASSTEGTVFISSSELASSLVLSEGSWLWLELIVSLLDEDVASLLCDISELLVLLSVIFTFTVSSSRPSMVSALR